MQGIQSEAVAGASSAGGRATDAVGLERSGPAHDSPRERRCENAIVAAIICAVLIATSVPYLIGYASAPPGGEFLGPITGRNDYCVYLSWARQAADGQFFIRNLFTTEPQHTLQFNGLFLLLGGIARVTGWQLSVV